MIALVSLKPYTEIPLLLKGLAHYQGQHTPAFRTLNDVYEHTAPLDVHPRITQEDLDAFYAMMNQLEEPIPVPFDEQDLWYSHGVFHQYRHFVRPSCSVSQKVMVALTDAVGALPHPPY